MCWKQTLNSALVYWEKKMIEMIFLGTSSMVPTKERNQSSLLISYKNHGILVDCGEGTQRQLKIAGIPITKVKKILISHWHGDHTLGLPGLIQSLAAASENHTIDIYGPRGTKARFEYMLKVFVFDRKIEMNIHEIKEGKFLENEDFYLEAMPLEHSIETLGFNFVEKDRLRIDTKKTKKLGIPEGPLLGKLQDEKSIMWKGKTVKPEEVTYKVEGKKISIISDTVPCKSCDLLAKDADILVCEATYSSTLNEKSEAYRHMTGQQAALIASRANAKRLILVHFSARYKVIEEIEEDAKAVFPNTVCAYDFMKIKA